MVERKRKKGEKSRLVLEAYEHLGEVPVEDIIAHVSRRHGVDVSAPLVYNVRRERLSTLQSSDDNTRFKSEFHGARGGSETGSSLDDLEAAIEFCRKVGSIDRALELLKKLRDLERSA